VERNEGSEKGDEPHFQGFLGEIKSNSLELDSPASELPQGVSPDPRRLSSRFVSLVI